MATNGIRRDPTGDPEDYLEKEVKFPDGSVFVRLKPITDFRKDPGEARMLYTCKRITDGTQHDAGSGEELIMKTKAQWPGPQNIFHEGPSPETSAELVALQKFADTDVENVPHLITWKKATQPEDGIHPGGYVIYIIMTKMPGGTLWDLGYWGWTEAERNEVRIAFMRKLNEVRGLGIAPFDCALRNVLWDRETKQASIVDFEHYKENFDLVQDEKAELQRWGLVHRPPPAQWHLEWMSGGH